MARRTLFGLAAMFLLAPALTACGSSVVHLSREEYDRLPHESREEIFDAENDLVIARDQEDDAAEHKEKAQRAIGELDQQLKRATSRLTAARVEQVHRVFDKHRAYLDAEVDVAAAGIRMAGTQTALSRARLQLVRLRQLARVGRVAAASLKPSEDKVAQLEQSLKGAITAETESRAKAQSQLDGWKSVEDSYARASGDYDTGIWGE